MTKALNKSIIEGRVVRVPELKKTKGNISYCNLIIAVNESIRMGDQTKRVTNYISVAVWSKTAEACCTYLKKGQKVRIEGKLRQAMWTDTTGMKHSKLEINCDSIMFLELPKTKKNESNQTVSETHWTEEKKQETDWAGQICETELQEI